MAVGGGSGGGGTILGVSNPFTGPANSIEILENHAYAYSGTLASHTDPQTALEFTTGNYYWFAKFYFCGPTKFSDPNTGRESNWQVSLNGGVIAHAHNDTSEDQLTPSPSVLEILIPSYTVLKVEFDVNDESTSYVNSVVAVGRIYR